MKGQIRMFETIGVLLIFLFLLGLGASVYTNYSSKSVEKEEARIIELKRASAADNAFYLPELDCNFVNVETPNCFDKFKVQAFSMMMQDDDLREEYFSRFGFAEITVRQLFPEDDFGFVLYNNSITDFTKATPSRSPVLLYDQTVGVGGSYSFGLIEVMTYAE